jgi:hypothetical protein
MAKIVIDTESEEARGYIAYLLWCADNGSVAGARTNYDLWRKYESAADAFLRDLKEPMSTAVFTPVPDGLGLMVATGYRDSYEGLTTIEDD